VRKLLMWATLGILATSVACGSGSSSSSAGGNNIAGSANNVAAIIVDSGPAAITPPSPVVNSPFVSVKVCTHGSTSACQTIDHVLVDTGSIGLRLLVNTQGGELNLSTVPLSAVTDTSGNPISECSEFVGNVSYGSVRFADIYVAGETTAANSSFPSGVPIQVIGDLGSIPATCTATLLPVQDMLQNSANPMLGLYANGIMGIGPFPQDCGLGCMQSTVNNPELYYSCPASGCVDTILTSIFQEVFNPVVVFPADNNGTIVELPTISSGGQNNVTGSLVFGIGTQSNNGLGSAKVFPTDPTGATVGLAGAFTTIFSGTQPFTGFIDSGSNGLFIFNDSTPGLTVCSDSGFFCSNLSNLAVQNQGYQGSPTANVNGVNIVSADTLLAGNFTAYNNLAGPSCTGPGCSEVWDWGLPFFFGRNVFTAIEDAPQAAPGGTAPYFAY
jgi:hypothetical protein